MTRMETWRAPPVLPQEKGAKIWGKPEGGHMSATYLGSVVFPGVASINSLLQYYCIIPTKVENPLKTFADSWGGQCPTVFRVGVK